MILDALFSDRETVAARWAASASVHVASIPPEEVAESTRAMVAEIGDAIDSGASLPGDGWSAARYLIEDVTRSWRENGVDARSMSRLFRVLGVQLLEEAKEASAEELLEVNELIDELLLWSLEARLDRLSTLIEQQREEMDELSTPFIQLYEGIALLPLVGTLDSERAERVLETLVEGIAHYDSRVVILDITGVPAVDLFVAGRLIKSVDAARLMGADCIVSGIGPRIALTMARLGADLSSLESTSKLEDALERSFTRLGLTITAG